MTDPLKQLADKPGKLAAFQVVYLVVEKWVTATGTHTIHTLGGGTWSVSKLKIECNNKPQWQWQLQ